MEVYEDLVKRLRFDAAYMESNSILLYASPDLNREAADAIEEMQRCIDGIEADNDSLCAKLEELTKPKWIPVTERMPEDRVWVLCKCRFKINEVLRWQNFEWYHDSQHRYFKSFVTHWQPLPDPPEGGNNDGT